MIYELWNFKIRQFVNLTIHQLLHFFVLRMLPATRTKLLQLQTLRHRLTVLGGRIVSLLAIAALYRNNLSGHCYYLNPNVFG
jgi:hypothetical protein